ncbi:hypothetical protein, partial [Pseudomonas viridiflava]|uniref:hypothetical protein n=1 Tax=Pseudomonas viridiflava TaxID=33069 RepID=UPI001980F2ED
LAKVGVASSSLVSRSKHGAEEVSPSLQQKKKGPYGPFFVLVFLQNVLAHPLRSIGSMLSSRCQFIKCRPTLIPLYFAL